MTEQLSASPAPSSLRLWVDSHSRAEAIHNHGFELNLDWWNQRIAHLPGYPVRGRDGQSTRGWISRESLFALASAAVSDNIGTAALRLFWHTLVWGTGSSHRNSPQRIKSVEANPELTGLLLRDAARLATTDPREAFFRFRPRGNAIKSLGPNFFTKFLYFAGAGNIDHACPIVDRRVLRSLHRETQVPDLNPKTTNYGFTTYSTACQTMSSWAYELSTASRTIGVDEVERWAFATGK